ncbi:hypothetical protein FEQ05_05804 [Burkholderia pseudomultivorans]|nr:hypothetical protein [Burkholderia pseudomultivorans]
MLVREDRHRVAHQRHVVGDRDARRVHRPHVALGVLRRAIAEAEPLNAAALVLDFLRLGQRFAQIVENALAGRARRISADRHFGRGAARGTHLRASGRDALLTVVHRVQPPRVLGQRRVGFGDARTQCTLVFDEIARTDTARGKT